MTLPTRTLEEFRRSAIPDRLTRLNIEHVEGDAAVRLLAEEAIAQCQRVTSYVTRPAQRILKRYEFARKGGWVSFGSLLDGSKAEVPYFKSFCPRKTLSNGRVKDVKYETSAKMRAVPLLPFVSWIDGLQIARAFGVKESYEQRIFQARPAALSAAAVESLLERTEPLPERDERDSAGGPPGSCYLDMAGPERGGTGRDHRGAEGWERELLAAGDATAAMETWIDFLKANDAGFWQWLQLRPEVPIGLTEGGKKGLSLTAHGIPTIAVRGITQWHVKGSRELQPEIAQFVSPDRVFYIAFDQDSKPRTRRDVTKQAIALGDAIAATGAVPKFLLWDGTIGKGIDDCLFAIGEQYAKAQEEAAQDQAQVSTSTQLQDQTQPRGIPGAGEAASVSARVCGPGPDNGPASGKAIHQDPARGRRGGFGLDRDRRGSPVRASAGASRDKRGGKQAGANRDYAGNGPSDWLTHLTERAASLTHYRRHGRLAAAIALMDGLNRCSFEPERTTEGNYMPDLPPLQPGVIHAVSADMNAGKTTRIGQDWCASARALGWNVLGLVPNNALGKQTAKDYALPHIHDYCTDRLSQQALWAEVMHRRGIIMCPDSLHRIPAAFWQRPTLLILDEANQVTKHMTDGDTLGSRYADIWERFSGIAQNAAATGAIVLSEANLCDRTIQLMQQVSNQKERGVRLFQHRKRSSPWDCTLFNGHVSGYRAMLLERVVQGKRVLYVSSSQREAKRLERAIAQRSPESKVVRIDSETNEGATFDSFFEAPDQWLQAQQPDVLILSPSAKSGLSIEGGISIEDAYFSEVWGYFPALATSTHMQQLGRYRPPVPRFIYVPPFILAGGDEALLSPRAIARRLKANLKGIAGVFGLDDLTAGDDRAEQLVNVENAILDYLKDSKAVQGAQKSVAREALIHALEGAGHNVVVENVAKDSDIAELWRMMKEKIWREEAAEIASLQSEPEYDTAWAYRQLDGLDTSRRMRLMAHKVLWQAEFPGVLFDEAEECYQCLTKDHGAMRRGVSLQAYAENLEAAKEGDRPAAEGVLKASIRPAHKLPKRYVIALLISQLGLLEMLDGQGWTSSDPRAIAVKKAALYWAKEIRYWLRLNIKAEQTPAEIVNKLLRKLGLKAIASGRPGKRGEQRDRVWRVEDVENPYRMRLLEALRSKLYRSVSTIINGNNLVSQIADTGHSGSTEAYLGREFQGGDCTRLRASLGDRVIGFTEESNHFRLLSDYS